MIEPKRTRPQMQDYGLSTDLEGMLTWDWVRQQMEKSRSYWLCTASLDAKPHAAPIWAVWMDDVLYFGTSPQSRKGRNFLANPNVVIHLESGDETVIFEGHIEQEHDMDLLRKMAVIYGKKYDFTPEIGDKLKPGEAYYRLVPSMALAWVESDFPRTATRFTFE